MSGRRPGVTVFVVGGFVPLAVGLERGALRPYGGEFVRLALGLDRAAEDPSRENPFHRVAEGRTGAFGRPLIVQDTAVYRVAGTERLAVDLRGDVHRGHAGACAVLVVAAARGVDADLRLAAVHARREGLHRFVIVVEGDDAARGDAVEREVRGLLTELGVEGDACPALRLPDGDAALQVWGEGRARVDADGQGRPELRRVHALRQLVALLDELPAFVAPDPLRVVPAEFATEAALLDVALPLYMHATLLRREYGVEVRADGGSYLVHDRYFGVAAPRCLGCGWELFGYHRIDARTFVHATPPAHRLFEFLRCPACQTYGVTHGDAPSARTSGAQPEKYGDGHVSAGPCWTLPAPRLLAEEHPLAAARLQRLTGRDDGYERLVACTGAGVLMGGWHAGGHHFTGYGDEVTATPRCGACDAACVLVHEAPLTDGVMRSLWACGEHPERAVCMEHG